MNTSPPPTPVAAVAAITSITKPDSSKLAKKDEASKVEPQFETSSNKSELVVLWMFIAAMMILTAVAGYLLWKKVTTL
jgi:hypothetical protein